MSANMIAGYHDLYYIDREDTGSPTTVTGMSIGATGPEGIRQNLTKNFQEIKGDALGPDTTVDTIVQGGNCMLEFVLQELNLTQVRKFIAPARATTTPTTKPTHPELGVVGHLGSSIFGILFAVPRAGTPAALAHGGAINVREYRGHVINDLGETLDTTHNAVPIQFLCLPFVEAGGDTVWFELRTAASLTGLP